MVMGEWIDCLIDRRRRLTDGWTFYSMIFPSVVGVLFFLFPLYFISKGGWRMGFVSR